jgi:hypothetical protein
MSGAAFSKSEVGDSARQRFRHAAAAETGDAMMARGHRLLRQRATRHFKH